ncbi:MAG: hypothetical protein AcusKO_21000 [Acuticoccus sp.]
MRQRRGAALAMAAPAIRRADADGGGRTGVEAGTAAPAATVARRLRRWTFSTPAAWVSMVLAGIAEKGEAEAVAGRAIEPAAMAMAVVLQ